MLTWRVSNILTADIGIEAVQGAILLHGRPEIFNTGRGSQFASLDVTRTLKDHAINISMDGKG